MCRRLHSLRRHVVRTSIIAFPCVQDMHSEVEGDAVIEGGGDAVSASCWPLRLNTHANESDTRRCLHTKTLCFQSLGSHLLWSGPEYFLVVFWCGWQTNNYRSVTYYSRECCVARKIKGGVGFWSACSGRCSHKSGLLGKVGFGWGIVHVARRSRVRCKGISSKVRMCVHAREEKREKT